jgi:dTDP-4-dehydrorhamnose reductase
MKIIVTGANGQLGQDIVNVFQEHHEVVGYSRTQWDVTSIRQCQEIIKAAKPDIIIHAAAYTAVDLAEFEVEKTFAINANGTRNIAMAAEKTGAKLCYISTDYVFDGTKGTAYNERDITNPQTVYGRSKMAGERFVTEYVSRHFIVRTSWLYGSNGNNYVKKMLKQANEPAPLKAAHDQVGSPTYTLDLCGFLLELLSTELYGLYHASNSGSCSRLELSKAILNEAGISKDLIPCSSAEFKTSAFRPANSALEHGSIQSHGLRDLRPWREALHAFLTRF